MFNRSQISQNLKPEVLYVFIVGVTVAFVFLVSRYVATRGQHFAKRDSGSCSSDQVPNAETVSKKRKHKKRKQLNPNVDIDAKPAIFPNIENAEVPARDCMQGLFIGKRSAEQVVHHSQAEPDDLEEECWEYIDSGNVKRGPFSGTQMYIWFKHGMLPGELLVRHDSHMAFSSIKTIFHPPMMPFMSRPVPDALYGVLPQVDRCHERVEPCWEYVDPTGLVQGTFSDAEMSVWFCNGMLPQELPVRHNAHMPFTSIQELFHPPYVPFRCRPEARSLSVTDIRTSQQCWEYQDAQGLMQGPFSDAEMTAWYEKRFLPDTLRVRCACCRPFVPFAELFHPPLLPFRSRPLFRTNIFLGQRQLEDEEASDGNEDCEVDELDAGVEQLASRTGVSPSKWLEEAAEQGGGEEKIDDEVVTSLDHFPSVSTPMSGNVRICAFDVCFSQQRARPTFRDGRRLSDTIPLIECIRCQDREGKEPTRACWFLKAPFPPIQVKQTRCKLRDESGRPKIDPETGRQLYDPEVQWFTLDNRRLYCYQRVAVALWPDKVLIDVVRLPPGAPNGSRQLRKFRTLDSGRSIIIGDRYGGPEPIQWCWRDNIKTSAPAPDYDSPDSDSSNTNHPEEDQ